MLANSNRHQYQSQQHPTHLHLPIHLQPSRTQQCTGNMGLTSPHPYNTTSATMVGRHPLRRLGCQSPPERSSSLQRTTLPAITSVLNGFDGLNGNLNGLNESTNGDDCLTVVYHQTLPPTPQLAIITAPIVIADTNTTINELAEEIPHNAQNGRHDSTLAVLSTIGHGARSPSSVLSHLQELHPESCNGSASGGLGSQYKARYGGNFRQSYVTSGIGYGLGGTLGNSCASGPLPSGLDGATIDGSPLLSFSEVTNTLLNQ